jgi:hypothetical protein
MNQIQLPELVETSATSFFVYGGVLILFAALIYFGGLYYARQLTKDDSASGNLIALQMRAQEVPLSMGAFLFGVFFLIRGYLKL